VQEVATNVLLSNETNDGLIERRRRGSRINSLTASVLSGKKDLDVDEGLDEKMKKIKVIKLNERIFMGDRDQHNMNRRKNKIQH
jgi:hypothetical protein